MNWVGGSRKRIKIDEEKKKQEAFFKKRKVDAALRKFKPQPQSPLAGLSQDILFFKTVERCFSKSNYNSSVAKRVIHPEYNRSLEGSSSRKVELANRTISFKQKTGACQEDIIFRPLRHSTPTKEFKNNDILSSECPESSLATTSLESAKNMKQMLMTNFALSERKANFITRYDNQALSQSKRHGDFQSYCPKSSENLNKLNLPDCKYLKETGRFLYNIDEECSEETSGNVHLYEPPVSKQKVAKENNFQECSFLKTQHNVKQLPYMNSRMAVRDQDWKLNKLSPKSICIPETLSLKCETMKVNKSTLSTSIAPTNCEEYQMQSERTCLYSSVGVSSLTDIKDNAGDYNIQYYKKSHNSETAGYSNVSEHIWHKPSIAFPYKCRPILKTEISLRSYFYYPQNR